MKQKKVIGIDIGTVTTKVAEGSLQNGKIFLDNYGIYKLPELKKDDGKITNAKEWAKAFKKQLRLSKIKTKEAYLIFSDSQAIIRKLELPRMPQDKIKQNLMFQLPEYLPQDIDDYVIDYKILNQIQTDEKKGYELFVVAILKSAVTDYVNMLKMANIKVKGIDVESHARGNLIQTMTKQVNATMSAFGIIDIGYRFTDVSIFQNGNYYINRVIDWGLEQENMQQDEQTLIDEIMRVFTFYRNQNEMRKLDQVIIVGGGVLKQNIREPLLEQIQTISEPKQNWMANIKLAKKTKNPLDLFIIFNALALLSKEGQ